MQNTSPAHDSGAAPLRTSSRIHAGLRNFWVLSTGGHEWANGRRYLHQTAQIMFPDCDGH